MMDDLRRSPDDNPTVGIILCAQKDVSVVRYSVLHENEQLFASRYKLVLPSEMSYETNLIENATSWRAKSNAMIRGNLPLSKDKTPARCFAGCSLHLRSRQTGSHRQHSTAACTGTRGLWADSHSGQQCRHWGTPERIRQHAGGLRQKLSA